MLSSLYIRDFALIEELEVDFTNGLNIITGETGAGKSIVIGAVKLILGERASMDVVRSGARKAVIEGIFDSVENPEIGTLLEAGAFPRSATLILRREVSETHSRAFINDTPATVHQLKEIASELVDLHGQHEHQSLLNTSRHSELVDAFGGLGALRETYSESYKRVKILIDERELLLGQRDDYARQKELHAFQIHEIDSIDPQPDEEEHLQNERTLLENAEHLFTSTASLFELIHESESSLHDQLVRVRNALQDLERIDPAFESHTREIQQALVATGETAKYLQDYNSRIEFNPDRLETIRERLIDIDRLKMRYGGTIESVLDHRKRVGEQFDIASDFEGTLDRMQEEIRQAEGDLSNVAARLSAKRKETSRRIERSVGEELSVLGIPDARFHVRFETTSDADGWIIEETTGERILAFVTGSDRISFMLSTNVGEDVMPLARVASGGEVSRVMLALKSVLARTDRLPVMIFDEIDSGISGAIARRVGERMRELGRYHQLIAITHLAQVASLADAHYHVEKKVAGGRSSTTMKRLGEIERHREIAALLSGETVSEASLDSARELIEKRK